MRKSFPVMICNDQLLIYYSCSRIFKVRSEDVGGEGPQYILEISAILGFLSVINKVFFD